MIIPSSGSSLAIGASVGGAGTGLLRTVSGILQSATAGADYLTPTGIGNQLTGLTAAQIGSVPSGPLKGSGGSIAAASYPDVLVPVGASGGQTLYGGTGAGENLQLYSTAHATKGKILIGSTSAFDGANSWLGIGIQSPASPLDIRSTSSGSGGYSARIFDDNATNGCVLALGYTGAVSGNRYKAIFIDGNGLNFGTLPDALNASPTSLLTLATNGNLGVNVGIPLAKLHVNGDVRITGVRTLFMTDDITYTGRLEFATNAFTLGVNGNIPIRLNTAGIDRFTVGGTGVFTIWDGGNFAFGTSTGTKLGTAGGAAGQKLGVWGATPIVQPLLATGAGATVDNVITVLQNIGLCRQS